MKEFFQAAANVAGLAGISMVVFLLITRGIIGRVDWPKPTRDQAKALLDRMLLFAFILASFGIIIWATQATANKAMSEVRKSGGQIYFRAGTNDSSSQSVFSMGPPPGATVIDWEELGWQQVLKQELLETRDVDAAHLYERFREHFNLQDSSALRSKFEDMILSQTVISGNPLDLRILKVEKKVKDDKSVHYVIAEPESPK